MVSGSFLFGVVLVMFFVSFSVAIKIEVGHDFEALEPSPPVLQKKTLGTLVSSTQANNGRVGGRKMKIVAKEMVSEDGTLNVGSKLRGRRSSNSAPKVDMGGFMAFTSDYHVPKPHPPKNN